MKCLDYLCKICLVARKIFCFIFSKIYIGRHLSSVPEGSVVFFPISPGFLFCGLAGVVGFKSKETYRLEDIAAVIKDSFLEVSSKNYRTCREKELDIYNHYLGGEQVTESLLDNVNKLKTSSGFCLLYKDIVSRQIIEEASKQMSSLIQSEAAALKKDLGYLSQDYVEIMTRRIEVLKDVEWNIRKEIFENMSGVDKLINLKESMPSDEVIKIFKKINTVLNSIDYLEVRGRDSAGISQMFILEEPHYEKFLNGVKEGGLSSEMQERTDREVLLNRGISIGKIQQQTEPLLFSVTFTYKVAAEIGHLGDNISFIRQEIRNDNILHIICQIPCKYHTISAHTRWASVGAITPSNCHPVDNRTSQVDLQNDFIIQASLNGDIDNHQNLKEELEKEGLIIPADITTDTKIIPLQVSRFIKKGMKIEEAFLTALNTFEGSHAIFMVTDLAPGKLFLAQRGSGQAVFVGLARDHYLAVSEVYGFVEETSRYLKMDGEKIKEGSRGSIQGQIFILDQNSDGKVSDIKAMYYDGEPIFLGESDVKTTKITSRDIDRQDFPHYFLKEISEAPVSVEKTLLNRWKVNPVTGVKNVELDEKVVPLEIRDAFIKKSIKRIFFVGQGTAGIAAQACADILNYYFDDPAIQILAMKASELSGFKLSSAGSGNMEDTLVVAITQSGTTADTNRTVVMARERGAYAIAIVNRRDSDITFKVHGVMYTSSGRDIEMSVASTKAFYSQIVAGSILGLFLAGLQGKRSPQFIAEELQNLIDIPRLMQEILSLKDEIRESARRLAQTKTYWAVVGSGPNKSSADEIRIKLSELCYKTISSDYVEDKKHIDLSSEPLIIVCAAGTRGTVIGDIIKDTAIFKAHKASVVVIADEGEYRFASCADDVFHVPSVEQHLAPIVNTMAGHIWGYYAALSINEGSKFLYNFRKDLLEIVDSFIHQGMDVYELVLERSFREKIAEFYYDLKNKNQKKGLCAAIGYHAGTDLFILLKYLAGRLPVSDFFLDFGVKGTAQNMLNTIFESLGEAINNMARPVDAIKHQAKTVTVGTSRLLDKVEGVIFDVLEKNDFGLSQLTGKNLLVLKNLQQIVSGINGHIIYSIEGLNLLGELTDKTTISISYKSGSLAGLTSRVESDNRLQGTKRIIVNEGNVFIGKGRKDERNIIIIPILSADSINRISNLLLLHIDFKDNISLSVKIKALGGKHERIKNIVQENSLAWKDDYLELVPVENLFGQSAEKTAEYIGSKVS